MENCVNLEKQIDSFFAVSVAIVLFLTHVLENRQRKYATQDEN